MSSSVSDLGVGGRETAGEVNSGVMSPSLKKFGTLALFVAVEAVCALEASVSVVVLIVGSLKNREAYLKLTLQVKTIFLIDFCDKI
jgi:hypothetical protein